MEIYEAVMIGIGVFISIQAIRVVYQLDTIIKHLKQ